LLRQAAVLIVNIEQLPNRDLFAGWLLAEHWSGTVAKIRSAASSPRNRSKSGSRPDRSKCSIA
jgi:hypothetical protein